MKGRRADARAGTGSREDKANTKKKHLTETEEGSRVTACRKHTSSLRTSVRQTWTGAGEKLTARLVVP